MASGLGSKLGDFDQSELFRFIHLFAYFAFINAYVTRVILAAGLSKKDERSLLACAVQFGPSIAPHMPAGVVRPVDVNLVIQEEATLHKGNGPAHPAFGVFGIVLV